MTLKELVELHNKGAKKKPGHPEHDLQCSCVQWFDLQYPDYALNLFAVPNGGRRDKVTGARLKAEGVRAGVSDLILLVQRHGYGALLIEMKTRRGAMSAFQKVWREHMQPHGYKYVVCRSLDDFIQTINDYMND